MQTIAKVQLKKQLVNGFSVFDESGLLLGVRPTITKADTLAREHPGSRVQMDQFTEEQLAGIIQREEERASYPPTEPGSETRIRSITPNEIKGDDRLHFMSQPEIDALFQARRLRDLRLAR